jgi:hypothetical protein
MTEKPSPIIESHHAMSIDHGVRETVSTSVRDHGKEMAVARSRDGQGDAECHHGGDHPEPSINAHRALPASGDGRVDDRDDGGPTMGSTMKRRSGSAATIVGDGVMDGHGDDGPLPAPLIQNILKMPGNRPKEGSLGAFVPQFCYAICSNNPPRIPGMSRMIGAETASAAHRLAHAADGGDLGVQRLPIIGDGDWRP